MIPNRKPRLLKPRRPSRRTPRPTGRERVESRPWRASAFTLVELLVVIAIIALLMTLLTPSLRGAIARAKEVQCFNQLRQVGVLCINYARDNKGDLPKGNSQNPMTMLISEGNKLDAYMRASGIPSNVWYCTSLGTGVWSSTVRSETLVTANTHWLKYIPDGIISGDEFRIGYFYLGGLSHTDTTKFKKVFDLRRISSSRYELLFDITASWEASPTSAADVPADRWNDFPHAGPYDPRIHNSLFSDGSVMRKPKETLTLGYQYIHPRRAYW